MGEREQYGYGTEPSAAGSEDGGGNAALLQSAITEADAFTASVDGVIERIIGEVNKAIADARDDALEMLGLDVPQQYGPIEQPGEPPVELPVDTIVDEPLGGPWGIEIVGKKKAGTTNSALDNMLEMRSLRTDLDALRPEVDTLKAEMVVATVGITTAKSTADIAKNTADKALMFANAALARLEGLRSSLYRPAEHNTPSDKYTPMP